MARASKPGKLTAKPAAGGSAPPILDENLANDLGDARALIATLTAGRADADWNVKIYHVPGRMGPNAAGNRQQFLFECQLEELPTLEQQLAEQFPGGGIFRVMIRADNQLVKTATLDIAPRPGYKPPPPSYLANVPAPPTTVEAAPDRVEGFFSRMADMMERSARETRELIASLAANREKPPTLLEQLQVFGEIQKLMPKAAQENTQASFEKGMAFAKTIYDAAEKGGGGGGWMDIILEALKSPVVKELVQQIQTAAPAAAAALAPPAAVVDPFAPAPAPGFNQAAPARLVTAQNVIAANAIKTLVTQAENGMDPAIIAQQALNTIPENYLDELEAVSDDPAGIAAYLAQEFPGVAQHRAWFDRLVAEMYEPEQAPGPAQTLSDPNARPENSTQPAH